MSVPDYTIVTAIDEGHFKQLSIVWLTWKTNKPSLLSRPMLIFIDRENPVPESLVRERIDHPNLKIVYWPPEDVNYPDIIMDEKHKFGKAQRYKIMAGFVHVPAEHVQTPYWLKLDSDAVAEGQDEWEDPDWFLLNPAVVGHRWGFTKPAGLPARLDEWATGKGLDFPTPPLDLPLDSPDSERISHPRICSWCAFFNTHFTRTASRIAENTEGKGRLPVPSQDTYLWYFATRTSPNSVVRVNMKQHGWNYRSSFKSVYALAKSALDFKD